MQLSDMGSRWSNVIRESLQVLHEHAWHWPFSDSQTGLWNPSRVFRKLDGMFGVRQKHVWATTVCLWPFSFVNASSNRTGNGTTHSSWISSPSSTNIKMTSIYLDLVSLKTGWTSWKSNGWKTVIETRDQRCLLTCLASQIYRCLWNDNETK